ncbi:hypothetical protein PoB_003937500 [Plakobranchus ocellatus]|uniref:Uncharacterized protein n=1 Tax=Plakobranchus ocellatus TaxID=259542 RepID=A0AAV4B1B0_9GAST|nr:hypothetical protein PoB_003937500 [Plakobranchus ocellatus]
MLRKDLTRSFGALADKNEASVLQSIKTLAMRQANIIVAWVELHQMRQDRDEPGRAFCARLKHQAGIQCHCERQVDYSETMIRNALIRVRHR